MRVEKSAKAKYLRILWVALIIVFLLLVAAILCCELVPRPYRASCADASGLSVVQLPLWLMQ